MHELVTPFALRSLLHHQTIDRAESNSELGISGYFLAGTPILVQIPGRYH